MKAQTIIILLAVILASCASVATPVSTETPVLPTLTSTAEVIPTVIPSPMPTQPILAVITPDAMQVERWKQYQAELAKMILCDSGHDCPYYEFALCEWDILGRSSQEVYCGQRVTLPTRGTENPL